MVRLLLLLLCLLLGLRGGRLITSLIVVVVVMALKKFLAQFLLSFMNVLVQPVAVLADREFLVVVYRNVDTAFTIRFVFRRVELGHVRVCQGLLCGQPFVWVEVKKIFE